MVWTLGIEPPLMMASEVAAHEGSIKNLEENLKNVGLFGTKLILKLENR